MSSDWHLIPLDRVTLVVQFYYFSYTTKMSPIAHFDDDVDRRLVMVAKRYIWDHSQSASITSLFHAVVAYFKRYGLPNHSIIENPRLQCVFLFI